MSYCPEVMRGRCVGVDVPLQGLARGATAEEIATMAGVGHFVAIGVDHGDVGAA